MTEVFEKIDVVQLAIVIAAGAGLIAGIVTQQTEVALTLGGGLVGYLGGGGILKRGEQK